MIGLPCKMNFFLSREKSYSRKLNEIFLALKIEQELTKEEILNWLDLVKNHESALQDGLLRHMGNLVQHSLVHAIRIAIFTHAP